MIRKTTPVPSRRQRKRSERTEQILDQAMALVEAGGLEHLTMPRLAQELDAAVGAIYRYFPGKDAVISGLQLRAVGQLGAMLTRRVQGGDPLERVVCAAATWEAFRKQEPAIYRLVDLSLSDPRPVLDDEAALQVEAQVREALQPLVQALKDAESAGLLGPGDGAARAHAIWAAVHGLGHFRKRDRLVEEGLRAHVIGEILLGGLLIGWGADPAQVLRAIKAHWI